MTGLLGQRESPPSPAATKARSSSVRVPLSLAIVSISWLWGKERLRLWSRHFWSSWLHLVMGEIKKDWCHCGLMSCKDAARNAAMENDHLCPYVYV